MRVSASAAVASIDIKGH